MTLSKQEYDAIVADDSKVIVEDIVWEGKSNSPMRNLESTSVPMKDTLYS